MKRSITFFVHVATAAALMLGLAGCGGSSGSAGTDNSGTVVLRVNGNQ